MPSTFGKRGRARLLGLARSDLRLKRGEDLDGLAPSPGVEDSARVAAGGGTSASLSPGADGLGGLVLVSTCARATVPYPCDPASSTRSLQTLEIGLVGERDMAGGGHAHASLRTSAGCARSAEVCNTASATHGAFSAEASTTLRPHALEASSSLRACGCPGLVDVPLFTVLPGSSSAAEFSATLCLEVPLSRALCTGMLLSCCSESPIWEDAAPAAGCLAPVRVLGGLSSADLDLQSPLHQSCRTLLGELVRHGSGLIFG
eukprot:CAMPEP_0195160024 /NCGR_PEP_ID=MMETSP0448-20130528/186458_1 /TAXON_ID=66468 /ORGANISM="Heterocapsa triquestra, Strain CCMP 448" /LENGTH=259 /DNA_ID=CAMNT_0040198823 /DNA_START=157 /DNA_END=938 /DNA_ORIENTATION=-